MLFTAFIIKYFKAFQNKIIRKKTHSLFVDEIHKRWDNDIDTSVISKDPAGLDTEKKYEKS